MNYNVINKRRIKKLMVLFHDKIVMEGADMDIKKQSQIYTNEKEGCIMSPMEMLECERVAYVNGMEEYLQKLKSMDKKEAQKISFNNLVQSQIIYENGEFTEHYESSKNTL